MMIHKFIKGINPHKPTLILLHGTGGDENDLLPIGKMIDGEASILSVRGEVIENGMPRFFRRLAPGVFDEQDLMYRTSQLHDFIDQASKTYDFDRGDVIAVGYSNGANIAANMLLQIPFSLRGAILMHPMLPRKEGTVPELKQIQVLITAGNNDPMVPIQSTQALKKVLDDHGALVSLTWFKFGHKLSSEEIQFIIKWYNQTVVQHPKQFN
jgi:phospholipase/carboxylesterase